MYKYKIGDYVNLTYLPWHLVNVIVIIKDINDLNYKIILNGYNDSNPVNIPKAILENYGTFSFKSIFNKL